MKGKTTYIFIGLLLVAAFLAGSVWTKRQGLEQKKEKIKTGEVTQELTQIPTGEEKTTIGGFSLTQDEVCQEDGKPIVYFFGGSFCPHCRWEHPIVEKVATRFTEQISFHHNMDKTEADQKIWNRYQQVHQGGVPFLVLGCRYVRVGSGERPDKEGKPGGQKEEEENLTALICKLTQNQPEEACTPVKELVGQIKD